MRFLLLDIETTPLTAHTWGLFRQNISINQLLESTEMMCFGAKWLGEKRVIFKSVYHHGKDEMLNTLWDLMNEADVLVGWNSKAFDHKHIGREFIEAGINPPSPTRDLDLMLECKKRFRFPSYKLDYVAQRLGVGGKVKHSGFDLWLGCMAGKSTSWAEMRKYQIQDVELLVGMHDILKPWIKNYPNVSINPHEPECTACASPNLQKRGFEQTQTMRYQRYHCRDCGKWNRARLGQSISATRGI